MRPCTCLAASSLLLLTGACVGAPPAPPLSDPGVWWFHHDAVGVGFELPIGWQATESGEALIFSGPAESPAYYTTLTLQAALYEQQPTLDEALVTTFAPLTELPDFRWHAVEPTLVATRPALRYSLQAELHESPRLKQGVLFDASGAIVHLAYSSTPDLFPAGLPVFERVLTTLAVVDTTP